MHALEVLRKHHIPCGAGKGGSKIGGCVLIEVPKEFAEEAERLVLYENIPGVSRWGE